MGKKKRSEKHQHAGPDSAQPAKKATAQKTPVQRTGGQTPRWVLPFILIVTFLAFIPSLSAGFVNWDDDDYVVKNVLLKDPSRLSELLSVTVQGNYHPLTMLSLALNHAISGIEPWSYHWLNLLLHLVNCILVFKLAMHLSRKNIVIAFTTAMLFGIHPLHVESVAWISERKDVLYGLFFIAGLISYTKYLDTSSKKQYLLTMLFLVLSLLSKPAAVIFPVTLFCIDILRQRKWNLRLFIEKIPFFIPAVVMGVVTYLAQKEIGATEGVQLFPVQSRMLFACYGIMMYVIKMIFPVGLSTFYPFPPLHGPLPVAYYLAPVFVIALLALAWYGMKKNRVIAFGILFFLVNLVLVLQFLSVGSAIIAERYTYIPYIGLFYIIGWLISRYSKQQIPKAAYILVPLSCVLAIMCYTQATVWTSSQKLWDQAIKNQPSSRAYNNRGGIARANRDFNAALASYNESIRINPSDAATYIDRGNIYLDLKKLDLAYADYKKALDMKPGFHTTLDNMGALYAARGQFDSALYYLEQAIKKKPDYYPAYLNRGFVYAQTKQHQKAIDDYTKYLEYSPNDPNMLNDIGAAYQAMGKYNEALVSINKAIAEKPQEPRYYLNRSYCYYAMKNVDQARRDALVAKQSGFPIDPPYAAALGIQ